MTRFSHHIFPSVLALLFLSGQESASGLDLPQFERWKVSEPIFTPGPKGAFDDIAVKDPTIVFFADKYHLIYTTKSSKETPEGRKSITGAGYVSAPTLEELNEAKRYDLNAILDYEVIAPQVFFFEPHGLWYLIAQTPAPKPAKLAPIYSTNSDIGDVHAWSRPKILETGRIGDGFWIDFWVICDEDKAHLFYTDHKGSMFRIECPLPDFPRGFAEASEEEAFRAIGEDQKGPWRLHEASHIYRVKKEGLFLAILEGIRPHPTKRNYWDSRNRFMFAAVAESLEGPWRRLESDPNAFLCDPSALYTEDGSRAKYHQVSHPELIRSGYDQKLEIESMDLQMLFQGFDATGIGDDYDYNYLPWELALTHN